MTVIIDTAVEPVISGLPAFTKSVFNLQVHIESQICHEAGNCVWAGNAQHLYLLWSVAGLYGYAPFLLVGMLLGANGILGRGCGEQ